MSNIRANLFIVGAQKCGTSALFQYLAAHPQIVGCEPKEPHFFASNLNNFQSRLAFYHSLFKQSRTVPYYMDGSTSASMRPDREGVADVIHLYNPESKIIYVTREPMERIVSHYRHRVQRGTENRRFADAVLNQPDYVNFTRYFYQLEPYLQLFGPERLAVLRSEELDERTADVVHRITKWLELPPFEDCTHLHLRHHVSDQRVIQQQYLSITYPIRRFVALSRIYRFIPRSLRSQISRFARKTVIRPDLDLSIQEDLNDVRNEVLPVLNEERCHALEYELHL